MEFLHSSKRWMQLKSARKSALPITPIIIYGDDVSHVVTGELKKVSLTERGTPETTSRK
jgi:hypothetical protein